MFCLKEVRVVIERMEEGKEFQKIGAATENARSPIDVSLVLGLKSFVELELLR